MKYTLGHVKNIYRIWGKYPLLYKLACIITFLGQENSWENIIFIQGDAAQLSLNTKVDAQLPSGFWSIFNPLIAYIYKHWASWDYTKNISEDLQQLAVDTKTERYNGGTIFITYGTKNTPQLRS